MAKLSSSNGLEKRPKLRFPGFDEPYKQCRIGDIYAERSQRGASNMELLSVTMNDGVKPRSEIEGKDNSSEDKSNYKIVRKGDMVYNSMRMWQGANGISPCDGIVSPAYTVLMPKQEINNGYFAALFKSANLINEFRKNSQGMTSDTWNLKYPQIETIKIQIPSVSEQDKVSELFGVLDARIVAQAQLIEALKKYKRGSLSALFPKKGEITPQYRFAGFTKPWEQRKLSEMCGTFEYGLNAAAKEFDGKNKYIRITDIDDASREFLLSDLSSPDICLDGMSKYLLSSGDIVFARTGASVGKTYIYRENDGIVYFAGFLIRAKVNQDNDAEFVFQSTLSPSYEKYIRITSQRSGQPGVNAQEYGEYDLFAPSKEEQQRIGHFLRGIDNLITLHQHKYDILLSLKNALLQQLFI